MIKAFWKRVIFIFSMGKRLYGRYAWRISFMALLGFVSGFLESIGIGILIPIFSIIVNGDAASGNDSISLYVVKIFNFLQLPISLSSLMLLIIGLFVSKAFISVLFSQIGTRVSIDFETSTRIYLYKKALLGNWPHLLKQKIGHLENILMFDLRTSTKIMQEFTSLILDFTGLITYAVVAFSISRFITSITLLVGGLLFLFLQPIRIRTRRNTRQQNSLNKSIAHHVNEHIFGLKSIKAFGIEKEVARKGEEFFDEIGRITLQQSILKNIVGAILSPISMIFIVIIFFFSYGRPTFNLAIFAATIYLIQRIFIHTNSFQKTSHLISDLSPSLSNVYNLLQTSEKYLEKDSGNLAFTFSDSLKFRNISFSYTSERPVLAGVSFEIKKGEMVGISGPSGAGKTTIVDLLLRLLLSNSGEILLDGKNINEIKINEWRRNIGYVPQDDFLLNDTISNNIRFYDSSITQGDIVDAAKSANIYKFISGLKEGFDTQVGERGVSLSGGQKQRIVMARALARKPQILVLDEATSSLDHKSEEAIMDAIKLLKGRVTIVSIAHRPSTIMISDKLLAIVDGKVREYGTPSELLKNKDSYFISTFGISK